MTKTFFGSERVTMEFERSLNVTETIFKLERYYRTKKGRWYKEVTFKFGETIEEHIEILRDWEILDLFLSENNTVSLRKYFPDRYSHLKMP